MTGESYIVQDIRAWRRLLPDWQPTLGQLQALEAGPDEYLAALRSVARGWSKDDARWDVLLALFEYERRKTLRDAAEKIRNSRIEDSGSGVRCCGLMVGFAADLIDPDKQ